MHCEIFIVTLDTDRMRQLLYFVKCSYFRVRYFAAILCIPADLLKLNESTLFLNCSND